MRIIQRKIFVLIFLVAGLLVSSNHNARAQSAFEDPAAAASGSISANGLVAIESQVNGGPVLVGSSAQVVMLFQNDSIRPVNVGAINLFPSSGISATISMNQCASKPLKQGAKCAIAFSIKGLQPGAYRLGMLINHDGPTELLQGLITGNVESTGDAVSDLINDIDPVPAVIEFESVSSSRPQVRSIILRNITSQKIEIDEIFIQASPQSGFTLDTDCLILEAGQACLASVTWTPAQEGQDSGVLVLRHNGPTGISSVPINGEFEPETVAEADIFPNVVPGKGLLVSSQTEVDFGDSVATKSSITVSLVNVGDKELRISDISLSNDENGINISDNGCRAGTILDPVEACPMTIEWEPVREGSVVDDIRIRHNGARGILILPLRGAASQAVNKDSKAIVMNASVTGDDLLRSIPAISMDDINGTEGLEDGAATAPEPVRIVQRPDITGILDGFIVTSIAPDRGIVNGPGGSRVVFEGEETVIGGVLWQVDVRSSSIAFINGDQQVLLLFDKSLSSVNRVGGQSVSSAVSEDSAEE